MRKSRRLTYLITSGPTREYFDPVRFISNASSGRMGAALARAALARGHRVLFVTGPAEVPPPEGVKAIAVTTAREMFAKTREYLPQADIVIGAAAVADYRPAKLRKHKLKKTSKTLSLELVPNPDILRYVGARKGGRVVVGFALESRAILAAARRKREEKNLDLIVANAPASIGSTKASVWLIDATGRAVALPGREKDRIAERIIDETIGIKENH